MISADNLREARDLAWSLRATAHRLRPQVFRQKGGRLTTRNGAHEASLFGLRGTCTAGEICAVRSWIAAVDRVSQKGQNP